MAIDRKELICRISMYKNAPVEIEHAIDILNASDSEFISNKDIGDIWERVSKAIDSTFSNDENHDAWKLELELAKAYKRD